eukprot:547170-Pelagomonas_calceolata.AAC.1
MSVLLSKKNKSFHRLKSPFLIVIFPGRKIRFLDFEAFKRSVRVSNGLSSTVRCTTTLKPCVPNVVHYSPASQLLWLSRAAQRALGALCTNYRAIVTTVKQARVSKVSRDPGLHLPNGCFASVMLANVEQSRDAST